MGPGELMSLLLFNCHGDGRHLKGVKRASISNEIQAGVLYPFF